MNTTTHIDLTIEPHQCPDDAIADFLAAHITDIVSHTDRYDRPETEVDFVLDRDTITLDCTDCDLIPGDGLQCAVRVCRCHYITVGVSVQRVERMDGRLLVTVDAEIVEVSP